MTAQYFDFIIVGAGASGLLLARKLSESGMLKDHSLLLLDKTAKTENDRTWSFWDKNVAQNLPIDISYPHLRFRSEKVNLVLQSKKHLYQTIKGSTFYRDSFQRLLQLEKVVFLETEVLETRSNKKEKVAEIITRAGAFKSKWAFDSRPPLLESLPNFSKYRLLWQHFLGYVIETQNPVFTKGEATMFDFAVPQNGEVRFMYVLPFSERKALVEYTIFGPDRWEEDEYKPALEKHLSKKLKVGPYAIREKEFGAVLMTDYPFTQRGRNNRVIPIGLSAGMAKPSTGYAFARSSRDADQLVSRLLQNRKPRPHRSSFRFRLYDAMMLYLMDTKGDQIQDYFTDLYTKVPMDILLSFLDDRTHFFQDLRIMNSVPPKPFIKALVRILWRGLPI